MEDSWIRCLPSFVKSFYLINGSPISDFFITQRLLRLGGPSIAISIVSCHGSYKIVAMVMKWGFDTEGCSLMNWSREDIGVRNKAYLRELLLEISLVDIIVEEDLCVWDMAIDGIFSVGDTRLLIDVKILPTLVPPTSWEKTLSRKVNIFIWRLALDRLPHRLNLSAWGMDIASIACPSCNGNVESSSHIFFDCDFAKEIWRLIRSWCDFPLPTFTSYGHWKSWFTSWQAPKQKSHRLYIIIVASFWWIWRFRNSGSYVL
ncbi:RNA-directed DNA polymerase, eukaryota [Tanacetum coccineum]